MSTRRRLLPVILLAALAGIGQGALVTGAHASGPQAPGPRVAGLHTAGLRITVEKPHFTCERGGVALSHVAYRPDPRPVLPCCDGQIGCAQFLSTSTVLHPPHRWHG